MSLSPIPALDASAILKRYGLRANKSLGQNFLQEPIALEKIINAAEIQSRDSVLEIGPGLGSLTRYLAVTADEVIAVELDPQLIPPLKAILASYSNVRIVQGDILKLAPGELIKVPHYLVVANIPYYITSAVIRHVLESDNKPRRIVLTIQKEVAERICAEPGYMSLLALSVQIYGEPHIAAHIPAEAFFPIPTVDSAVLCVDIYDQPLIQQDVLETFFRLTKAGFSQKRKTLRNALSAGLRISTSQAASLLTNVGIDPRRRAETLSIEEWSKLSSTFAP